MSVSASKVKYSLTPLDITHSPGVEQLDEEEKQVIIIITNGKGSHMYRWHVLRMYCIVLYCRCILLVFSKQLRQ